jgi:hypothetical protein
MARLVVLLDGVKRHLNPPGPVVSGHIYLWLGKKTEGKKSPQKKDSHPRELFFISAGRKNSSTHRPFIIFF